MFEMFATEQRPAQQTLEVQRKQQRGPLYYSPIRNRSGVGLSRPERESYQTFREHYTYNRESSSPDSVVYDSYDDSLYPRIIVSPNLPSSRDNRQPEQTFNARVPRSPLRRMRYPALDSDVNSAAYSPHPALASRSIEPDNSQRMQRPIASGSIERNAPDNSQRPIKSGRLERPYIRPTY